MRKNRNTVLAIAFILALVCAGIPALEISTPEYYRTSVDITTFTDLSTNELLPTELIERLRLGATDGILVDTTFYYKGKTWDVTWVCPR